MLIIVVREIILLLLNLRDFIYDSSVMVRLAFLELLLKIKTLRTIAYHQ